MVRRLVLIVALAQAWGGCVKDIDDGGSSEVDFRDPKKVVAAVFYAAQSGDASALASLCDPRGGGNEAVLRVCAQRPGEGLWESFRRQFSRGTLLGEPRVSGDRALLNFAFGPAGDEPETMELVRRGDRWFLFRF